MIRTAILTEIISPYRIPVFNQIALDPRIDLKVIFFSKSDGHHSWDLNLKNLLFDYTVLPGRVVATFHQGFPIFFNPGILQELSVDKYDVVICGGYQHPTLWLAMAHASVSSARLLLWCESNKRDSRSGGAFIEAYKRILINRFDGFIVPGSPQKDYLCDYNTSGKEVWLAPNAVDNEFFRSSSLVQRGSREELRREMDIRGPVILYVGRLLDAKGIPDLLAAFERVSREMTAALIIVGSGPDRTKYEALACSLGLQVQFLGFQQQAMLPRFYAIADVFVFPTHSDPWGLVINEAMASGKAVIASRAAGAADDLVHPGINGYLFEPGNVDELTHHLRHLLQNPNTLLSMGAASQEVIQGYTPEKCAAGFIEAILG